MQKASYVFKRLEKKYLLTEAQAETLLQSLKGELKADAYGQYTVCNVYLDTDDYRLIRTSIEKPTYKEKLRLRSYGVPQLKDRVFLELKKKYKGVVYKRRISLTEAEAEAYLNEGKTPADDGQIFREIDWAMHLYALRPKLFLAYDRTAFSGVEDDTLRLTLDRNVRFRTTDTGLRSGDAGEQLLPPDCVLMEIKVRGAFPLWLSCRLSAQGIFPVSFSKYGRCYMRLCEREEGLKNIG